MLKYILLISLSVAVGSDVSLLNRCILLLSVTDETTRRVESHFLSHDERIPLLPAAFAGCCSVLLLPCSFIVPFRFLSFRQRNSITFNFFHRMNWPLLLQ